MAQRVDKSDAPAGSPLCAATTSSSVCVGSWVNPSFEREPPCALARVHGRPAPRRSARSSPLGCAVAGTTHFVGARLRHDLLGVTWPQVYGRQQSVGARRHVDSRRLPVIVAAASLASAARRFGRVPSWGPVCSRQNCALLAISISRDRQNAKRSSVIFDDCSTGGTQNGRGRCVLACLSSLAVACAARRAGKSSVRASIWWGRRIRPTSWLGCSTPRIPGPMPIGHPAVQRLPETLVVAGRR